MLQTTEETELTMPSDFRWHSFLVSAGYLPDTEKDLKTTPGSDCALNALAIDKPLEYAKLYLDGTMQIWVDAEDSLELW